jgi:5'-nucleotidase
MENKRPLILVSNDDGVSAKGIHELIRFLRPIADLFVVAPDTARSGNACAITATQPVSYELVSNEQGLTIYSCSGTPVDCIKLALHTLMSRRPDMVVGGINHGDNSGVNVHYSGTMGLTIEGCLKEIPSVGFSLCTHRADADFTALEPYIQHITSIVLQQGLPIRTCLNVNFPVGEIKGIRVCEQAVGQWVHEFEVCPRRGMLNYFWLTGEFVNTEPQNERTDNWALARGYASITPTKVDVTDYEYMERLREIL